MASTIFSYGTVIASTWLNDVNAAVYTTVPTLAPLNSPNFTNPSLNTATATSINKITFTPVATGATLNIADGKTLKINSSVTIAGTDNTTLTVPANATVQGTNTGDQPNFTAYKVAGQVDVVPATTTDNLTFVAGTGITLTTDNTAKSITLNAAVAAPSTMVLLGSATASGSPTTIDFLNIFTSAYDKYVIELEGVGSSFTDGLLMRFAEGGILKTDSRYYPSGANISSGSNTFTITSAGLAGTTSSTSGITGTISVLNPTITGGVSLRGILAQGWFVTSTSIVQSFNVFAGYSAGSTSLGLSGFRLYWASTSVFNMGIIRVYGIKNT